ncbi:MAG: COX15/CtaA family protein [Burkholderiales bacterium]|nr:Cytochrome oxidase assembly protein [Betaproteobacteria bacterium MOLA814]
MTDTVDLYNFSPLVHLLIVGALIAAVPLSWVWLRARGGGSHKRLALLATMTLFLTFDLVLFGAFTRLTDSGLGCPDWPGCYGFASPIGASNHIDVAQTAMPTGPVTTGKAWIEMVHRYLASGIGALIVVSTVLAWTGRRRQQQSGMVRTALSPWWATFTLAWVCLQGAFGALTVTMKLFPAIVSLHLLGGMVLLALLQIQHVAYTDSSNSQKPPFSSTTLRWVVAIYALLWLQIALGAWVSTNYAVLACQDFPKCQGQWWPPMDFAGGFEVWRALGVSSDGSAIAFSALTAIHYVHRLTAYVLLLAMVLLGWRLRAMPAWRVTGNVVWCVSAWQLVTGLSNVVLGWPLVAAVAHTGGAAAMVIVFTGLLARVVFDKRARAVEDQTVTPAVSKVATTSSQRSVA